MLWTDEQMAKAREAVEDGAVVRLHHRAGLYAVLSSDGSRTYVVDMVRGTCSCDGGSFGQLCYHPAAVMMSAA
jgi:hypothetical protein